MFDKRGIRPFDRVAGASIRGLERYPVLTDRFHEAAVVALVLIGLLDSELANGVVICRVRPEVTRDPG